MENVGSDGAEDVKSRKVEPEWMGNRLHTDPRRSLKEASWIPMERAQDIEEFAVATRSGHVVTIKVTQIVSSRATPGAVASERAGSQNLLRVVANETCEDRMSAVDITSSCGHKPSIVPCSNEGLKDLSEGCMIEVGHEPFALRLVVLLLKFRCGEIAKGEVCTHGGLPTDFLRNVADCHVNGVCTFISEGSELCLVCRNENRDYRRPGQVLLSCHLCPSLCQQGFVRPRCCHASHLRKPPPCPSVHVVVHPLFSIFVGVVSFGGKYQVRCKIWVAKQCAYTLNYVSEV